MTITKNGNERLRVMNGNLKQTSGGLRKKDLKWVKVNKSLPLRKGNRKIVSKRASAAAKRRYHDIKHLLAAPFE